jgi:hypothetical protein
VIPRFDNLAREDYNPAVADVPTDGYMQLVALKVRYRPGGPTSVVFLRVVAFSEREVL